MPTRFATRVTASRHPGMPFASPVIDLKAAPGERIRWTLYVPRS
jgi:hypothetical protein